MKHIKNVLLKNFAGSSKRHPIIPLTKALRIYDEVSTNDMNLLWPEERSEYLFCSEANREKWKSLLVRRRRRQLEHALDLLTYPIDEYKNSRSYLRYVECLELKYKIQKKMGVNDYIYTLFDLALHYSNDETFDIDTSIKYYKMAMEDYLAKNGIYTVSEKMDFIYKKYNYHKNMIDICEKILNRADIDLHQSQ